MCLVVLFWKMAHDAPAVVGANREEFYERGGEPPRLWNGRSRFVAGVDPAAGGTWLGLNEHGVLAAVTNRPKSQSQLPGRSRGLLVRDLLAARTAAEASDQALAELGTGAYAGCNLLCVDAERAVVIHAGDWLRVRPLPPGIHVLTGNDMNDLGDPRIAAAITYLGQRSYTDGEICVEAYQRLAQGEAPGKSPVCIHGLDRGTVSSSLIVLRHPLGAGRYLHAQGSPDRVPYVDYSHLLVQLSPQPCKET